jgi:cytochrome b subunit of formate dehydrogenase
MIPLEEEGARMAFYILLFILFIIVVSGVAIKWAYKRP